MYKGLKITLLYGLKYSGIFSLCKFYFRSRPRIICYHGFNILDESSFIPGTFINSSTFQKRIDLLKKHGAEFIPLNKVTSSTKANLPVVLTFDDGFVSTLTEGAPILKKEELPSTLYVTTYYQIKGTPIFRLHFQYLIWKSKNGVINWDNWPSNLPWSGETNLKTSPLKWDVIKYFETEKTEDERVEFLNQLEKAIGASLSDEQKKKSFTILNNEQLLEAAKTFDIQLHTHRHRLPFNETECKKEISENREILKTFSTSELVHFCYPSGIYDPEQLPWLADENIETATTLNPGIVSKKSNPLELPRILDNESLSPIQFESEICGVGNLLRSMKALLFKEGRHISQV